MLPDLIKLALKMTPMPHQQRVSDRLNDTDGLLVYHGLGSGKTFTAINAADQHGLPLLAIVPASLRNNMQKEIAASGFKGKTMVISYEEANRLKDDPKFRAFASQSLVTFDEAHRMGRIDSARSTLANDIPGAKKLFLTGTPMRNHPAEMGPLLNAIGQKHVIPSDPAAFNKNYVADKQTNVGFMGRLRGVKPGNEQVATNMDAFRKAIGNSVDYNPSGTEHFPTSSEKIINVPMSHMQQVTYDAVLGKYPEMAYKIMHGIPPSKSELSRFQAFSTGPRMIANHPGEFNQSARDEDAPKMLAAVDEIKKRVGSDPNYRGVSYSGYLGSGVNPLSRLLMQAGIAHATFDGTKDDEERKQIVNDYNSGKIKHLLVSGAGSEGLDLKGTKLMQIMEPHWNEARISQMKGRAIRYKSHDHLPENERHVEVQRFHSVRRQHKLLGGYEDTPTIDGYLHDMSSKKDALNQQFLSALQEPQKAAMPFKSKAQQRFMYANKKKLKKQGVDVDEWSDETDYANLPEKKAMFPSIDLPDLTKVAWDLNPKLRAAADITGLGILAEPTIHKWVSGEDAVSEREKDLSEVGGLGLLAAIEAPHLFGSHEPAAPKVAGWSGAGYGALTGAGLGIGAGLLDRNAETGAGIGVPAAISGALIGHAIQERSRSKAQFEQMKEHMRSLGYTDEDLKDGIPIQFMPKHAEFWATELSSLTRG